MTPRVSVVVPSYNNAGFIEATVGSIPARSLRRGRFMALGGAAPDAW